MKPFLLQPVFKDYLWGGTRLKTSFGKQTDLPLVAESWELSAHPDGTCLAASGPCKGKSFTDILQDNPEITGSCWAGKDFPILIKLIDAKQSLSIQVHPDDAYARRVEQEAGKTEMWIVLEALPHSFLYYGFEQPLTKEEMNRHIVNNTLTNALHKLPVKAGDVVYIPAGTVHAIGEGILLAEIQQSSNSTYRVYDFGRLGADGKPRELHIQKALDVTTLSPGSPSAPGAAAPATVEGGRLEQLARTQNFTAARLLLAGSYPAAPPAGSFMCLLCTGGNAVMHCEEESLPLQKGSSAFVPANSPAFRLEGNAEILLFTPGLE